jgi:hypothetical protein
MTENDQQPADGNATAPAPDTTEERRALTQRARLRCNMLGLYDCCGNAHCSKAKSCRGDPRRCLREQSPRVPDTALRLVDGLIEALDEGLDINEAAEEVAEFEDAFSAWREGLRYAARVRRS